MSIERTLSIFEQFPAELKSGVCLRNMSSRDLGDNR